MIIINKYSRTQHFPCKQALLHIHFYILPSP